MSYKRTRAYLFKKSYAYTVFQACVHTAKWKNKRKLRTRIAKILLLGNLQQTNHLVKIGSIVKNDEKLAIYIQIERELALLANGRKKRGAFDLEKYEYALLDPAIERVAGASLAEIEDDRTFDLELIARKALYQYWYYQTAAKYKLPTLRLIPFLLRLLQF